MSMNLFPDMVRIVPAGKIGSAEVRHYVVPEFAMLAAAINGDTYAYTPTDRMYSKLIVNGELMMSDTYMERDTCAPLILNAYGNVLIAGLGLGMVLHPLLLMPQVKTVTVVEQNADVIALIEPTLPEFDRLIIDRKGQPQRVKPWRILHTDIFDYLRDGTLDGGVRDDRRYETIWLDIWPDRNTDNLKEISALKKLARRWYVRPQGDTRTWCRAWYEDELRAMKRRKNWR